jgi:serine/threonine-protein kinase RsbW
MTLELHATPEEVMRAVEALQQMGQSIHLPEKALFALALSLEECGSNIVNHALQRDPQQKFYVQLEHQPDAFLIELRDRGPAFDPTSLTERKTTAEEDDLPGGWGVHLVRRYMDHIHYQRVGDENVLRLTKRLAPPPAEPSFSSAPNKKQQTKTKN